MSPNWSKRRSRAGTQKPEIILDPERKWQAFGEADAALVASGTVSLELALSGVPMVSCYKLDPVMRLVQRLITVWAAPLPNLIADRPVVPEYYNQYVRPRLSGAAAGGAVCRHRLPRLAEGRLCRSRAAAWRRDRPSGEIAAEVVLRHIRAVGNRQ